MKKCFLLLFLLLTGCNFDRGGNGPAWVEPMLDCSTLAEPGSDLDIIDTRATPRAIADAEWLALEVSGEFMAPESRYQRVAAELTGIRASSSNVADIFVIPCKASSVKLTLDDGTYQAIASGDYQAWDTLNENLRAGDPRIRDDSVDLEFEGRYNMQAVAAAYSELPGVEAADLYGVYGRYDICLAVRGEMHHYIFERAWGDCPSGCIYRDYDGFSVDSSGNVRHLGRYETESGGKVPDWFEALDDCRAFFSPFKN